LALEVRYQLGKSASFARGRGRTIDVSSGGVLFRADVPIRQGVKIELSIAWPMRLDGSSMLQLVVRGQVVRTNARDVAVRIGWHQFRTRARRLSGLENRGALGYLIDFGVRSTSQAIRHPAEELWSKSLKTARSLRPLASILHHR
jgi:hypothetical protein